MALDYPYFLVNVKTYPGTAGEEGLAFARTVERVAAETDARFVVAPQTPDLRLIAAETSLPVVAQGVDADEPGRRTGGVLPETVAAAGADGVLVNHPERPAELAAIETTVDRCRELGLESIVCANGVEQARAVLSFEPDCLLFEKPEDVATGRAISRTHPERVEAVVDLVAAERPETKVFLGGGISGAADVAAAFDLGADAAGAASAAVQADDREAWLRAVAGAMPERGE
ncbi:triose-phosphate isomerase [Halomicrococcus gelatinilyticus]|uniref:triose-phosphate isomerase n=1 Tax=Halomicrococcus gelatinilyticus TaxID=1702103 RepID=UPI002E0ECA5F